MLEYKYLPLIAFPLQQWLRERITILRYAPPVLLETITAFSTALRI